MNALMDWVAADHKERLYLVTNSDGTHEIVSESEKKGRAGMSPSCNQPLRDVLKDMTRSIEKGAHFWVEFALERMTNSPLPTAGDRVHLVTPGFHAWTAFVEQRGGGFGGDRFDIEMDNGVKFWSENVWSRGTVPLDLRDLIKPNCLRIEGLRS